MSTATEQATTTQAAAESKPLNAVCRIKFSAFPKAIKRVINGGLKAHGFEKFDSKERVYCFYTEKAVAKDQHGNPLPPGYLAVYHTPSLEDNAYKTFKELRASGKLLCEITAHDVTTGGYDAPTWKVCEWLARKALIGKKAGSNPTREARERKPRKEKEWKFKYFAGYKVGLTRKSKDGKQGIQFFEGPHAANQGRTQVPDDCLTDDAESSLKIATPQVEVRYTAQVAEHKPYEARFQLDDDAFDSAE